MNAQGSWLEALAREADCMLAGQPGGVFHAMSREFETTLIRRALAATEGRRINAARLLGIGRNTIARKIHALAIDSLCESQPRNETRVSHNENGGEQNGKSEESGQHELRTGGSVA